MTHKFIIQAIPPSMNKYKGRQNPWEYRNDKKHWEELVRLSCRWHKAPIAKSVVELKYFVKTRRRHDPNNYDGQFITDGLVKAGVIADDSFDAITLVLVGDYDKQNPRTEISVTEVNDGETEI